MRNKRTAGVLAGCALVAVTGSLAACGGPGTITSHGTMTVDYGMTTGDPFAGSGAQVVVVNSAGTVIASTTLLAGRAGASPLGTGFQDDYTFTVTVPGGEPRYGIQVGGTNHGTIWETPAEMAHPALSLDLT